MSSRLVSIATFVALVACSEASDGPVPVDATVEVMADVDGEVVPADRECGVQADGSYRVCDVAYGDGMRSTLCDERRGKCFIPEAHCAGGWCVVPAASYVSGLSFEYDVADESREDAAISIVPRTFEMMETEVTNGDFFKLMRFSPPNAPGCLTCPVGAVSAFGAMEYANRLSAAAGLEACYALSDCGFEPVGPYEGWFCARADFVGPQCGGYRLPSRAEWELASRAGSPWSYSIGWTWGDCDPGQPSAAITHHCGTSEVTYEPCLNRRFASDGSGEVICEGPSPVGQLAPNPFGLFDTNGNVEEMVQTLDPRPVCGGYLCPSAAPTYVEPLRVRTDAEFSDVVLRDDIVLSMGGEWVQDPNWTASNVLFGVALNESAIRAQALGFRLVRTLAVE